MNNSISNIYHHGIGVGNTLLTSAMINYEISLVSNRCVWDGATTFSIMTLRIMAQT
jgi:hypothetical protein